MTIKATFSDKYKAKRARIRRLPTLANGSVSGLTKRDLIGINKDFHDGIKFDTFRLERLVEITIGQKMRKGYSNPTTPLYGAGDSESPVSYANMMRITKKSNKSWVLEPSTEMHHSGKITLDFLFKIHEHGCTVQQTTSSGETIMILIPPRPALLLAYRRYLIRKRKDKKERSKEVKQAITAYINDANQSKLKAMKKWESKSERDFGQL